LNDSFSSALRLQEDRFKSSVCIVSPDVNQTGNRAMGGDYLISLSQQLSVAITTGNQEYVKEILHGFYAGLAASTYSSQEIQSLYTLLYMNLAESIRLASGIDLDKQKEILSDMLNCADLKRLNDYFTTVMTRLCNSLKVNGPNNIISTLVCYIDNNYPKRITLASVSKVFGYNSRYLGRIFKKHTGKTFNQYLEGIRVKHAKELLDAGEKISEIARKVGFTDVNYFYLIFRQSEGCAPTEYRKKN
jgi:two-component system response regulator YesN